MIGALVLGKEEKQTTQANNETEICRVVAEPLKVVAAIDDSATRNLNNLETSPQSTEIFAYRF